MLTSDVEEPGKWCWNDHLPDIVPLHAGEHAEPEVSWNQRQRSKHCASEKPDPVNLVICDAWPAIHIEVLAKLLWVQL